MACISYKKTWGSEYYKNVSAEDKSQDINPNEIKLKVNDTYKKDEKK